MKYKNILLKIIILLLSLYFIFACSSKDDSLDDARAEVRSVEKEFNELRKSAVLYMYNSNWKYAIENLEKAIKIKPNEADMYFLLGISYGHIADLEKKYVEKSYNALDRFIKLKPHDPVGYYSMGILHFYNLNKISEAIDFMNKAIELDAGYEKAYVARGTFYYYDNMFREAINDYETALTLTKSRTQKAKYYLNIARVYKRWGKIVEARTYAQKSIQQWGNFTEAISFLNTL
jgi:tetratricopeptide (TPR) repeat protein